MFTNTKIALSIAVVLGMASSALATEHSKHGRHLSKSAGAAFANTRSNSVRHSSNPAFDVYDRGHYLGSDPDPRIRADLLRDPRDIF